MIRLICVFFALLVASGCTAARHSPIIAEADMPMIIAQQKGPAQVPVAVSADGRWILTTDDQHAGLHLTDWQTSETLVITRSHNAGYYPTMNDDATRVGYKVFRKRPDGELEQAAMVYDRRVGKSFQITEWADQVGTPALGPTLDRIAVSTSTGVDVLVLDEIRGTTALQHRREHSNVANQVVFNPAKDELGFILADRELILGPVLESSRLAGTTLWFDVWGPVYSPDGTQILLSTLNGKVMKLDPMGHASEPTEAQSPGWLPDGRPYAIGEGGTVMLLDSPATADAPKVGGRWYTNRGPIIASQMQEHLVVHRLNGDGTLEELGRCAWEKPEDPEPVAPTAWPADMADDGTGSAKNLTITDSFVRINGVPYIHQVHDVPDWFNGHWACNVTSALMCLAYWDAIKPDPITVSTPEVRKSNYARYICEPYSAGGVSFDIASPGPKDEAARGGYGYIVRENWKDTKNHMAEYIHLHGIKSSVDWSPSLSKIAGEINGSHPFVLLNSITLAGHYVTVIGYLKGKSTIITNDPYGDKNSRLYPHIDGRGARYDLPGSNNGYQNLRVVHCLIYTQGRLDPVPGG